MATRAAGRNLPQAFVGRVRRWRKEWTQVGRMAVLKWVASPPGVDTPSMDGPAMRFPHIVPVTVPGKKPVPHGEQPPAKGGRNGGLDGGLGARRSTRITRGPKDGGDGEDDEDEDEAPSKRPDDDEEGRGGKKRRRSDDGDAADVGVSGEGLGAKRPAAAANGAHAAGDAAAGGGGGSGDGGSGGPHGLHPAPAAEGAGGGAGAAPA